jgi:phosphoribosyl 1,2-cyclic phosphodiesterase
LCRREKRGIVAAVMRYCVLASGSSGNACVVQAGSTVLLIDLGIGPRVLKWRLEPIGLKPTDVDHLLITHEHTDHTKGIEHLLKRNPDVAIHASRGTIRALPAPAKERAAQLRVGRPLSVGSIDVHAFRTSHDGAESVGFRLEHDGRTLGYATDLGCYSKQTVRHLSGCDALVVESNHCPELLRCGPYPPFLKSRVAGRRGHLSNLQCRSLLEEVLHPGLRHVTLAHLSETNNTPDVAVATISELLSPSAGVCLSAGMRRSALPPVEIAPGEGCDPRAPRHPRAPSPGEPNPDEPQLGLFG